MPSILLVDDNLDILSANQAHLTRQGFDVETANTGIKALVAIDKKAYDCIVLDIMLPDIDGFTLCRAARTVTQVPIIFLTCLDALDDKLKGLMTGADEYMTKPYSLKELTTAIKSTIRRQGRGADENDTTGKVYIDIEGKMLHTPVKNVFLSQKEFDLFLLLYENPNQMFTREEIYNQIWAGSSDVGTVAVHILKLRRKIDFARDYIGTIKNDYKAGYYFESPPTDGTM